MLNPNHYLSVILQLSEPPGSAQGRPVRHGSREATQAGTSASAEPCMEACTSWLAYVKERRCTSGTPCGLVIRVLCKHSSRLMPHTLCDRCRRTSALAAASPATPAGSGRGCTCQQIAKDLIALVPKMTMAPTATSVAPSSLSEQVHDAAPRGTAPHGARAGAGRNKGPSFLVILEVKADPAARHLLDILPVPSWGA